MIHITAMLVYGSTNAHAYPLFHHANVQISEIVYAFITIHFFFTFSSLIECVCFRKGHFTRRHMHNRHTKQTYTAFTQTNTKTTECVISSDWHINRCWTTNTGTTISKVTEQTERADYSTAHRTTSQSHERAHTRQSTWVTATKTASSTKWYTNICYQR